MCCFTLAPTVHMYWSVIMITVKLYLNLSTCLYNSFTASVAKWLRLSTWLNCLSYCFTADIYIYKTVSGHFYRTMHFSAKRGIAIVCCPSVCPSVRPSVRLSVCPSVTIRYRDHIGWNSLKIISRPNSLRPLLWLTPTWAIWCNGNTPKIGAE